MIVQSYLCVCIRMYIHIFFSYVVFVCCFILLTRYWGIDTVPGFPRVNRFVLFFNPQTSGFWCLFLNAATQLATQLRQRCIQVVRSNKETRKCLAESNGNSAMDFGCEEIRKHKYTQTQNWTKYTTTIHPQQ